MDADCANLFFFSWTFPHCEIIKVIFSLSFSPVSKSTTLCKRYVTNSIFSSPSSAFFSLLKCVHFATQKSSPL